MWHYVTYLTNAYIYIILNNTFTAHPFFQTLEMYDNLPNSVGQLFFRAFSQGPNLG